MVDWKTCYFCPCSALCTENGALCQEWGSGPQKSPGPMGYGDQWHIDEIARLRAELAKASAFLGEFLALPVTDHGHSDLRARVRAFIDRGA